ERSEERPGNSSDGCCRESEGSFPRCDGWREGPATTDPEHSKGGPARGAKDGCCCCEGGDPCGTPSCGGDYKCGDSPVARPGGGDHQGRNGGRSRGPEGFNRRIAKRGRQR